MNVEKILLSEIVEPANESIIQLTHDIRLNGQKQPIIVVKYDCGYIIDNGIRRYLAMRLLKKKTIDAIVYPKGGFETILIDD